jgi:hypothetical protein
LSGSQPPLAIEERWEGGCDSTDGGRQCGKVVGAGGEQARGSDLPRSRRRRGRGREEGHIGMKKKERRLCATPIMTHAIVGLTTYETPKLM